VAAELVSSFGNNGKKICAFTEVTFRGFARSQRRSAAMPLENPRLNGQEGKMHLSRIFRLRKSETGG